MSEYVLISDSTTDITTEMIEELKIKVIPLTYTIDGKTYYNKPNAGIDDKAFYDLLRAGKSATTSQINSEEFIEVFEPYLKEGKDILYVGFSSGLSGTYQCSTIAQKELAEKYPDRKIIVFDSLSASMGEGLFVYHAAKMKNEGADIETVYTWLKENALKVAHWFTVDDLNHLKRGGRVSAASALVGTMLGIKPVLHVDNEGHLIPKEKVRGRRQSLDALVKHLEKSAVDPASQVVFISHGDALEDAEYVEKEIKKKFGVKEVFINFVGPVIGAHAGPGTIALFFLAENRD